MDDFFAYVAKEDAELKFNEAEYKTSQNLIQLRLKAILAQDIWGYNEFYQIYNESDEIIKRAVVALQNKEYEMINKKVE